MTVDMAVAENANIETVVVYHDGAVVATAAAAASVRLAVSSVSAVDEANISARTQSSMGTSLEADSVVVPDNKNESQCCPLLVSRGVEPGLNTGSMTAATICIGDPVTICCFCMFHQNDRLHSSWYKSRHIDSRKASLINPKIYEPTFPFEWVGCQPTCRNRLEHFHRTNGRHGV